MDGESSYESDISESWSLIDINLNEEPFPATDTSSRIEKSPSSKFKKVKLREIDERKCVRKCKEVNKTDFSQMSDSYFNSSFKDQELETHSKTEKNQVDSSCKRTTDDDEKNDSGDAESIEILGIDGNCQDSDLDRFVISGISQLDFATYQSDDEESLEERVNTVNRSNSSTGIKRRKRISRNSVDTVHNVNSENEPLVKEVLKTCSNDPEEENDKCNEESQFNGHPVYKHYRNNVVNTILSLSVGVIFAGVACIAIGHFLGVQDAVETTVELVEALKKLQVENAALQSRLSHLNEALLTREMNPNLRLPSSQPHNKVSCEGSSLKTQNTDLNNSALSEIRSSLNSIEWLSKIQNFIRKNKRDKGTESGIDFSKFGKYIHDQLYFLSNKEEKSKILEDVRKISKVLQKIFNRLSSYQENIENIYHETVKLKDKINQKFSNILLDSARKSKRENKMPITEFDLHTIQRNSKNEIHENSKQKYPESIALYKFPQPQKYYEIENSIKSIKETQLGPGRSNGTLNSSSFRKAHKEKKYRKKYKEKKKVKKEKFIEKQFKKKKEGKRKKWAVNTREKLVEKTDNLSEKEDAPFNSRQVNYIIRKDLLDEINFEKYSKLRGANLKFKRRLKKPKNSKIRKLLLTELENDSCLKKNQFGRMCSGSSRFNLTGFWVFKWADGREEFRRHHSLGDWQFERAKGRKEVRNVDFNDNWQFERANARKKLRVDNYNENWQFKRAWLRKSNRHDDRWHRGKHMKYNEKEFFHERFSWI